MSAQCTTNLKPRIYVAYKFHVIFSLKAYISRTLVKEVVCSALELFACVTVVKPQKNSDMTNLQFTIIIKKTSRQLKVKVSQGNRLFKVFLNVKKGTFSIGLVILFSSNEFRHDK